jgi:UDP-galactose transporter
MLVSAARQGWFVVAATLLMTSQPFITTLSKNDEGGYDYLAVSTTLVTECAKLCISATFYALLPASARSHRQLRRNDALLFAAPAFVYFINNNLIFVILTYVNSTTYQILSSLKTVFTGILFRLILKRVLSDVQIVAILLLAAGAAVSQFPICLQVCDEAGELEDSIGAQTAIIGAAVALVACVLSAFGGVYSELLLKKDGALHSIHLQNLLLYGWGVIFNSLALLVKDRERIASGGLLQGYSPIVLLLIANNACVGLAISAVLKFANNLVRVFAHTASMLLTMVLETCAAGSAAACMMNSHASRASDMTNAHPAGSHWQRISNRCSLQIIHGRASLASTRHIDCDCVRLDLPVQPSPATATRRRWKYGLAAGHHSERDAARPRGGHSGGGGRGGAFDPIFG